MHDSFPQGLIGNGAKILNQSWDQEVTVNEEKIRIREQENIGPGRIFRQTWHFTKQHWRF